MGTKKLKKKAQKNSRYRNGKNVVTTYFSHLNLWIFPHGHFKRKRWLFDRGGANNVMILLVT